jgi:hypothetical protein
MSEAKALVMTFVIIGVIINIISIMLLAFLMANEGVGAIYVIVVITLILDIILLLGFFVLILAATRGE